MKNLKKFILPILLLAGIVTNASVKNEDLSNNEPIVVYFDLPDASDAMTDFVNDPISYLNENFNILDYLEENQQGNTLVTIRTNNGNGVAIYNNEGKLVQTKLRFKDISPSREIIEKVWMENEGWSVTQVRYSADGNGNQIDKKVYKLKLEKDGKKKTVKYEI